MGADTMDWNDEERARWARRRGRDPERIERILEKLRIIWNVWDREDLTKVISELCGCYGPEDDNLERAIDRTLLVLEKGVETRDGDHMYFLDRIWLVTKDELYED